MHDNKKNTKKLLIGILSSLPGAGHMSLGLIRKGFTMMTCCFSLVFFIILFSDVTNLYWLSGFLIPVVSVVFITYSIFDSLYAYDKLNSGEIIDDAFIELNMIKNLFSSHKKSFSIGLIILGNLGILSIFTDTINVYISKKLNLSVNISTVIFSLLLLLSGLLLIKKSK